MLAVVIYTVDSENLGKMTMLSANRLATFKRRKQWNLEVCVPRQYF